MPSVPVVKKKKILTLLSFSQNQQLVNVHVHCDAGMVAILQGQLLFRHG